MAVSVGPRNVVTAKLQQNAVLRRPNLCPGIDSRYRGRCQEHSRHELIGGVQDPQSTARNPSRPFYIYARPESEEIATITHLEFGRATHRVANILRPNREAQDEEVVAIIAQSDTVLNSFPGLLQLLRTTSCYHIAATCSMLEPLLAGLKTYIADVGQEFALEIQEVSSLLDAYPNLGAETENCPFQPYPTKVTIASLDGIAMYIHSSGSTGLPGLSSVSPFILRSTFLGYLPPSAPVADVRAEAEHWEPVGAMVVPPFHIIGVWEQLVQPLADTCGACRSLVTVPIMLTTSSESPAAVKYLKTLDRILFAGGPLPQRIRDDLVKQGLRLISAYGATKFGAISSLIPYEDDIKEWAWGAPSQHPKKQIAKTGDFVRATLRLS
ncbi:hypothetical protein K438DRAFT_1936968 [Mycena galopus ATCC 62051]|nr:hypothetical protein K438DRAFT_1936968 [Mycena galopus ATCC 62051]